MIIFNISLATLFTICFTHVFCANILFVSTVPSPSHHFWNRRISLELVKQGHNVTSIGADKESAKIQNYTYILMEGVYEDIAKKVDLSDFGSYGIVKMILSIYQWSEWGCRFSLNTSAVQVLLNYPKDKFDLILFDTSAGPCFYPLIQTFNYPPAVGVTAFLLPPYASHGMGNHVHPSYLPWYALPYTNNMTFYQRCLNLVATYIDLGIWDIFAEKQHKWAKGIFGNDIPSREVLENHISLLLSNTDPILEQPQPLPPNIIPVGGLHTGVTKPLPQDLQEIMDRSKDGVIIFSLGSNVRSDKLVPEAQQALLAAFSKLKETVIWKFESDAMKNMPKNVIVRKWLPQTDLLGHNNTKLFIGHGGALSTHEAIFHGVPMIAVPFFTDQHVQTKNLIRKKIGLGMELEKFSPEYVLGTIRELLDNPIYRTNIKTLSRLFKDRSETPLERAIFWIEYVLRHKGADFLQPASRNMSFVKSYGIDVVVALVLIVIVLLSILALFIRKLFVIILNCFYKRPKKVKVQ